MTITSIGPRSLPTASKPSGGDTTELARLRKEYSACVNCSSAKTSEGQRGIQQLDNQIKTLEARMKKVEEMSPAASATAPVSATATSSMLIDVYA